MENRTPSLLSDDALVAEVERLARTEHEATVALVAHLAELSARRLFLAAGYSSLFTYCREVLALSEGEAYNRVVAARAVRRFPEILDRLAGGSTNLTTIRVLYKHLTPENHRDLLDAAARKGKREVERLVAARFPQQGVPFSVRKVTTCVGPQPSRPASLKPCAEDQYNVRFTARATTWEKLQAAQELLRHSVPSGDVSEIFDRALTLLLEDLAHRKFAATARPRSSQGVKPGSREVPAAVKRAVWVRDCARCAFVSPSGRRCAERGALEFHHVHPYAAGGEATIANIALRCRAHNAYEAELFYGPIRKEYDTVRETIPGWDMSLELSGVSDASLSG